MSLKSTPENYGRIAKWLHWLTALLFLAAYIAVYYRHWFTEAKTPANWTALQLHLSFGVTIGVLVLLRICWRFIDNQPTPEPGAALAHLAAKLGHLALYLVMIGMPLTGYLGTGVDTEFFSLFNITGFKDTWLFQAAVVDGLGMDFKTFEEPIDFLHKDIGGAWLVWLLILGHAGAGLYHHQVLKDRTLLKMTRG